MKRGRRRQDHQHRQHDFDLRRAASPPAYGASKGGIVQLTKRLALAWAADNIQVNAILPGWFDTELTRSPHARSPASRPRPGPDARRPLGDPTTWPAPPSGSPAPPAITSPASPSPSTAATRPPGNRGTRYQHERWLNAAAAAAGQVWGRQDGLVPLVWGERAGAIGIRMRPSRTPCGTRVFGARPAGFPRSPPELASGRSPVAGTPRATVRRSGAPSSGARPPG